MLADERPTRGLMAPSRRHEHTGCSGGLAEFFINAPQANTASDLPTKQTIDDKGNLSKIGRQLISFYLPKFEVAIRSYSAIHPVSRNVLLQFFAKVARACLGSR